MNGFEDAAIGFGTGGLDEQDGAEAVRRALDVGYRHVDTAQNYGTEADVGAGIERSDVPRADVFLATKVARPDLAYDDVVESTERSLERLGVDAIDLLYVHWPLGAYDPDETLAAFDDLYEDGAIRNVGLSNFDPDQLDEARAVLDAPMFAHQFECHPLFPQEDLRAYADRHDHHAVAYCPLGRGAVLGGDVPEIESVAEKHDATAAQVALAWHVAKGIVPIPKASGDHIDENWRATDLRLDEEDVRTIDGIERRERVVDVPEAPWNR
ncbi:aldo/keto reductase [Halomicrobium salinisoli]|uniref:aldo/keto reductase n=1 Tax=Halomicrobium salinisoli TaxID=2878391 RepID=UPI001CF0ACDD|nr:aldo/keto reductase [Halomicrobium salinisoli]